MLHPYYHAGMGETTTVRLNDEESRLLADLVGEFGDQSNVIRQGIRLLAEQQRQRRELQELLREWESEYGPVDEDAVAAMTERYFTP